MGQIGTANLKAVGKVEMNAKDERRKCMDEIKKRLVVATGNKHKLREIAEIFTDFDVVSQKEMGFDKDVEETL